MVSVFNRCEVANDSTAFVVGLVVELFADGSASLIGLRGTWIEKQTTGERFLLRCHVRNERRAYRKS